MDMNLVEMKIAELQVGSIENAHVPEDVSGMYSDESFVTLLREKAQGYGMEKEASNEFLNMVKSM